MSVCVAVILLFDSLLFFYSFTSLPSRSFVDAYPGWNSFTSGPLLENIHSIPVSLLLPSVDSTLRLLPSLKNALRLSNDNNDSLAVTSCTVRCLCVRIRVNKTKDKALKAAGRTNKCVSQRTDGEGHETVSVEVSDAWNDRIHGFLAVLLTASLHRRAVLLTPV